MDSKSSKKQIAPGEHGSVKMSGGSEGQVLEAGLAQADLQASKAADLGSSLTLDQTPSKKRYREATTEEDEVDQSPVEKVRHSGLDEFRTSQADCSRSLQRLFPESFIETPSFSTNDNSTFITEWLESVDADKEQLSLSDSPFERCQPIPRRRSASASEMSNLDSDGFARPLRPASRPSQPYSTPGGFNAPTEGAWGRSSSASKNLVDQPQYRYHNLEANGIFMQSTTEQLPEHVYGLVNQIGRSRGSPGPPSEELQRDTNLQDLLLLSASEAEETDKFKGAHGTLWVAENQCLGCAASCVNIAERLKRQLQQCGADAVQPLNSTMFSIAMDNSQARLYVSWRDDDLNYFMQYIGGFLLQRPEDYIESRKQVRNIFD
ncbi:hypothetical protein VM1G_00573 [Cytospora mali]|uniref:DUF7924 domain-containing protein n=1 Tax=Cytospora mali TaxID=578113 RepID=A0A194VLT3_CYTMA|nr:hypothetical protein VM1G_00573 [Valsa mali]